MAQCSVCGPCRRRASGPAAKCDLGYLGGSKKLSTPSSQPKSTRSGPTFQLGYSSGGKYSTYANSPLVPRAARGTPPGGFRNESKHRFRASARASRPEDWFVGCTKPMRTRARRVCAVGRRESRAIAAEVVSVKRAEPARRARGQMNETRNLNDRSSSASGYDDVWCSFRALRGELGGARGARHPRLRARPSAVFKPQAVRRRSARTTSNNTRGDLSGARRRRGRASLAQSPHLRPIWHIFPHLTRGCSPLRLRWRLVFGRPSLERLSGLVGGEPRLDTRRLLEASSRAQLESAGAAVDALESLAAQHQA